VHAPLPDTLAQGIFWAQYQVENLRIVPVFGKGALNASLRLGHLHIQVDELPWWWADAAAGDLVTSGKPLTDAFGRQSPCPVS
jgi:hypothetical protein